MRVALHWLGLLLDSVHLVLAVTLVFIPEARQPVAMGALKVLVSVNGARMLWAAYRAQAFGMTPADMVRAPQRPKVSLVAATAIVVSVLFVTAV